MAKLSAHGRELDRREYCDCRIAVMSDGNVMRNFGQGWKLYKKIKPGVDIAQYAKDLRAKYDARPEVFHAYIKALIDCTDLEHRARLHMAITYLTFLALAGTLMGGVTGQNYFLAADADLCAASLNSPCGPSGRGSTFTHTCGAGFGSASVGLVASNPRITSSLDMASASARLASSLVDCTLTPVSARRTGAPAPPLPRTTEMLAGGKMRSVFAVDKASAISAANSDASMSPVLYQKLTTWLEKRLATAVPKSTFCKSVRRRHATLAWIFTRAVLSSSASLFNRAASFSFADARSWASLESLIASPARLFNPAIMPSLIDRRVSWMLDAFAATYSSPATPTVMRIPPTISNGVTQTKCFGVFGSSRFGKGKCFANSAPYSNSSPRTTVAVNNSSRLSSKTAWFSKAALTKSLSVSGRGNTITRYGDGDVRWLCFWIVVTLPIVRLALFLAKIIMDHRKPPEATRLNIYED